MYTRNLVLLLFCLVCSLFVTVAGPVNNPKTPTPENKDTENKGGTVPAGNNNGTATVLPTSTTVTPENCTGDCKNKTDKYLSSPIMDIYKNNKGMIQRTLYVLLGATGLVIIYFVVKTIRLRRRKSKTRKYGVLTTRDRDNMEMMPLDQDDEDEDMTVFEVNGHPK